MTEREYQKQISKIYKWYDQIVKSSGQTDGRTMLILQQDKNDLLTRLTAEYHKVEYVERHNL